MYTPVQSESRCADPGAASTPLYSPIPPTEGKFMRLVEHDQPKEMLERAELAESWVAKDGIVSHETTIKNVGEQVPNSEFSRPEFRRRLVAQCSILVVIAGIVAWLIAA